MNMFIVNVKNFKNYKSNSRELDIIQKMNKNDFNCIGFLEEPSNKVKKKVFDNKENYPILIINPIFSNNNNNLIIKEDLESNNNNIIFPKSVNSQENDFIKIGKTSLNASSDSINFISDNNNSSENFQNNLSEKLCLGFID